MTDAYSSFFQVPPLPQNWSPSMTIKDPVRKKNLKLTPEEWVRQHVLMFLNQHLKYPLNAMSLEKGVLFNKMTKRFDLVVYLNNHPFILVECKAQSQKLNAAAWLQTLTYQSELKAVYVMLTNGIEHYVFQRLGNGWVLSENGLPEYSNSHPTIS